MYESKNILIVGAGIGGLAAAVSILVFASSRTPSVTILEAATQFSEIGAGIQVAPNFTRLLDKLGLGSSVEKYGVIPRCVRHLRWADGSELTRTALNEGDRFRLAFGHRYYYLHRADLHAMLLERARELGARILSGKEVTEYRPSPAGTEQETIICRDGTQFEADLVIAADGVRSTMCEAIVGQGIRATPTGDSAYRALLAAEQVKRPEFEDLHLEDGALVWLGPDKHVVGYFVRDMQYYNLVILVPEDEPNEESWKLPGDRRKLQSHFKDWDERLRKLIDMVDSSFLWSLRDRDMLDTWLHPTGNMVLLGDSAHPMLPYVGQGAASAVEDAVVLADCLDFAAQRNLPLRPVLRVYEQVRRPRTQNMREAGKKNRDYFHMPDGPEQRERDARLKSQAQTNAMPNQLNNPKVINEMYGFDVREHARKELERLLSVRQGQLYLALNTEPAMRRAVTPLMKHPRYREAHGTDEHFIPACFVAVAAGDKEDEHTRNVLTAECWELVDIANTQVQFGDWECNS